MITEFTYSQEAVMSQVKSNLGDLVTHFSNYDSFPADEQKAYAINHYLPKLVSIASHLESLSKIDALD
ncbi:MAG: hypothetical protein U9Q69_01870, partial [Nanoarchaeota archaeon]|nr:hypothetical protein [Nanoarchaeota archaeon]